MQNCITEFYLFTLKHLMWIFHYKNVNSHNFSQRHHSCWPPFKKRTTKKSAHTFQRWGLHKGQFYYLTPKSPQNLVLNPTVTGTKDITQLCVTIQNLLPFRRPKGALSRFDFIREEYCMWHKIFIANFFKNSKLIIDMLLFAYYWRGPGAVIKAACLESRTPLWHSSYKRTTCFFHAHS